MIAVAAEASLPPPHPFEMASGRLCAFLLQRPLELEQPPFDSLVHYAGRYVHSNEVTHRDRIGGTIFDQANRVQEYLFSNMRKGMNLENLRRGSLEREDVYQWPLPGVREALVNLLGHRDYTQRGMVADVLMFPSHIGELL
jgi:hypothetical protein